MELWAHMCSNESWKWRVSVLIAFLGLSQSVCCMSQHTSWVCWCHWFRGGSFTAEYFNAPQKLWYRYSSEPHPLGPRRIPASLQGPHPTGHKLQQQPPLQHHFVLLTAPGAAWLLDFPANIVQYWAPWNGKNLQCANLNNHTLKAVVSFSPSICWRSMDLTAYIKKVRLVPEFSHFFS